MARLPSAWTEPMRVPAINRRIKRDAKTTATPTTSALCATCLPAKTVLGATPTAPLNPGAGFADIATRSRRDAPDSTPLRNERRKLCLQLPSDLRKDKSRPKPPCSDCCFCGLYYRRLLQPNLFLIPIMASALFTCD